MDAPSGSELDARESAVLQPLEDGRALDRQQFAGVLNGVQELIQRDLFEVVHTSSAPAKDRRRTSELRRIPTICVISVTGQHSAGGSPNTEQIGPETGSSPNSRQGLPSLSQGS